MKFKGTWVLAGMAVAFGAYLYFGEYKKAIKEDADKEASEKVLNILPADVRKLEIKNEAGDFIMTSPDGKKWKLESPLQDNADESMISGILGALTSSRFEETIEGQDLKNFGLDKPKSTVTLTSQGGAVKKVNVGSDAPIAGKLYLQRDGENKVLFADTGFKTQLNRSLKDLRDKKIFRKFKGDIEAINVKYDTKDSHGVLDLLKKDGNWILPKEKDQKADQDIANEFLNSPPPISN